MYTSLPLILILTGCQSEADALRAFCNFPEQCPECLEMTPAERQAALKQYIDESVRNRAARALITSVEQAADATSIGAISRRARELGLASCPMMDPIEHPLSEPIQLPGSTDAP